MLFSPFPLFSAPPASPPAPPALVATSAVTPAPIVYRQGAIMRDYLATANGRDVDLTRPDAVYAADNVAIGQDIDARLSIFQGEIPSDLTMGTDYAKIFAIGATQGQILSEIRRVILSVPGVREIASLGCSTQNGVATITWSATTNLGAIAAGQTTVNGGA